MCIRFSLYTSCSPWLPLNGSMRQGSRLGPIYCVIHINDLRPLCDIVSMTLHYHKLLVPIHLYQTCTPFWINYCRCEKIFFVSVSSRNGTRRPASTDRTARRQFQVTGQPVSRTQASDAMTSRLPRYETKCVQRRSFQWESVPLRSDIKGTELPPANKVILLERQLIALQPCR